MENATRRRVAQTLLVAVLALLGGLALPFQQGLSVLVKLQLGDDNLARETTEITGHKDTAERHMMGLHCRTGLGFKSTEVHVCQDEQQALRNHTKVPGTERAQKNFNTMSR